jgi:hypothetical protein
MKTSHLLLMAGWLAAIGLGLYVVVTPQASIPVSTLPVADRTSPPPVREPGGGKADELSAFRQDIDRMQAEVLALRERDDNASARQQALMAELHGLHEAVAELREHVRQTASSLEAASVSREETGATVPPPADDTAGPPQEQDPRALEQVARLETGFEEEPVDTSWAATTSELLTQVLDREDFAYTSVFDMECRSTICRLDVQHADAEAAHQFELMFPMEVSEVFPKMIYDHQEGNDGQLSTVIYMVRNGSELPADTR